MNELPSINRFPAHRRTTQLTTNPISRTTASDGENNECFEPVLRPVPAPRTDPHPQETFVDLGRTPQQFGDLAPQAATEAETLPRAKFPSKP